MDCCQLKIYDDEFDAGTAAQELAAYRRHGPRRETRLLLEALQAQPLRDATLLDIGGGVGVIQHELIAAGIVNRAVDVDASAAYLNAARSEAERRRVSDRVTFHHGDFVELASTVEPADIVTLDRVICCYPNMEALVRLSAERAKRFYGLVYPRAGWWMRAASWVINVVLRLTGGPLPVYIHSRRAVERIMEQYGFTKRFYRQTLLWQVVVYERR